MSIFPRKKPDELLELQRRIDTLEAVNRAQNVKIDRLEAENEELGRRIIEIELVLGNILSPEVSA